MPENNEILLERLHRKNRDRHRLRRIVPFLSLFVILVVFWSLKLTGIGVAGEAFCGMEEHVHSEDCTACTLPEHIHDPTCYSDITADLEAEEDWEASFGDLVRGPTTKANLVLLAQSQLGYRESTRNFQVDASGVRRGITRYGQWYGNPYGDWSAMFASFCLYYAGVPDAPANAGPEAMRLEWEYEGLYLAFGEGSAEIGDLLFLRKDGLSSRADAVAIITGIDEAGITVIEGDLDDAVGETRYERDDPALLGYGLVPQDDGGMAVLDSTGAIARRVDYDAKLFTGENLFVLYASDGSRDYAFDGNGNAVPITVDSNGSIHAEVSDSDSLLWALTSSGTNAYLIQNVSTGRYMHAYPNNGTGVTTSGAYSSTLIPSGTGVRIRSNSEYARINASAGVFQMTQSQSEAAVFNFGMTSRCTVWLDGTDGGLGHLTGSPDEGYSATVGSVLKLPTEWTSPSKYSYRLRGWYDVTNARYYLPGAEMTVTGNAVLYADWVASTYDIGQFNAQVADTVSTNSFITTHVFDYNYLFNLHSTRVQGTVTASGHSETWSMVTSGTVPHGNRETLDFVFIDNDSGVLLCIPNNRSSHNVYPGAGIVTPDIYSSGLGEILFDPENCFDPATGTGVLGKNYLGTGDHLFQILDDPSDERYGYYYYDSKHNAASYNQSRQRFYVYDYLSATSDAIGSTNSDFLPLNSPYANTNGKTVGTYNYAGVNGEYEGVPHYRYDSKYNSGNYNSVNNVQADYAYGMRTDINFYLPNEPGSGGNKDLYGNDLEFSFSGDDDLWVLIDGILVLDIGGIHGAESGSIDFSTGQVWVQDSQSTSLTDLGIGAGDHTLSVLYLERGSSLSNCSIYFNLAPRFGLEIKKEDVLTQEILNGAQFSVYEDLECSVPADLWDSEDAYNRDLADGTLDQAKNSFTVIDGVAKLWGLGSGNTYYIKETGPPAVEGYGIPYGIIRLTIEKDGVSSYHVDVIADADGNEPSSGFTVHGVEIDEETKTVYIVATNAPESVIETTTVQVIKKWEDTADHSKDYVQAFLTVTDPDGSIRRIREITLSDENGWTYLWTNLPKYDYDSLREVPYGIEESYESGYYSTVRKITQIEISRTEWAEAATFLNGESYLLKSGSGYLSTVSSTDGKLRWVDEETAKSSVLARWTATVSGGKVKFTNGAGQILNFYYGNNSNNRYFNTATGNASYQSFTWVDAGSGFRFYVTRSYRNYYLSSAGINSSGRIPSTTSSSGGLILTPMEQITETDIQQVKDWAYQITNTPLAGGNETSVAVKKDWDLPEGYGSSVYQEYAVTVRLLANGIYTGRTVTLNLKNGWEGTFLGLPYADEKGTVIQYTVDEVWEKEKWSTVYGEIRTVGGSPPTYSVVITNTYHPGGPELPATGTAARSIYQLCGLGLMLGALVYGIGSRRKRERRMK